MPSISIHSNRRGRLALLADSYDSEFQVHVLHAAHRAAREHDLDFIAVSGGVLGPPSRDPKHFVFNWIGPSCADAILVCAHTIGHYVSRDEVQAFADRYADLPRVGLGVELVGMTSLLVANESGMHAVVQHLVREHGLRRLAFLAGPKGSEEADARLAGYTRALGENGVGLDDRKIVEGIFSLETGREGIRELFDRRGFSLSDLDGIVCADDFIAKGALDELDRRNIHVPGQLAVVGFDDFEMGRYARVPLTTIRQPVDAQVKYAVSLLARAIAGKELVPRAVTFETELVLRRSCGCRIQHREARISHSGDWVDQDYGQVATRRKGQVVRDLERAAHGSFELIEEGWAGRLFDTLLAEVLGPEEGFLGAVETLGYQLLRRGCEVGALQDVLTVLRGQLLPIGGQSELRDRMEEVLQDAHVMAADLATIAQSDRRGALLARMSSLSDTITALIAAPDLEGVAKVAAEHLPGLGIRCGMLSVFKPGSVGKDTLTRLLAFDEFGHHLDFVDYPANLLAPDGFLENRCLMVLPLGFRGEALGLALLSCGAVDAAIYEELRMVLGAAIKGTQLMRAVDDARREVEALAITDPLTGLFNRRHLKARLQSEFARAKRHGRCLSLMVVDLDGFKEVNDQYGHDAGDRVLVTVAGRLRQGLRDSDTVTRYGGDEFVILLPETDTANSRAAGERIRQQVMGEPVDQHALVSATFGVATFDPVIMKGDEDELLRRADRALLFGKRAGKNRVQHADDL